jgi:glutamate-1-semialdehyde 2,1-aminomutase
MRESRSRSLYSRALSVLPGGVNSSVRAIQPYPAFAERGDGGHLIDADGNRYVDYVMGYGPLLLGHDMPERVRAAVQSAASDGPMFGVPTEVEVELAEFVVEHVPGVEMIRFVNSGTEATVSAVRLARGYTGRDRIVVMQGGYHGAQESTLVEGDGDDEPANVRPSSPGIPDSFAAETIPVPFNDAAAVERVFEAHGDEIACVLTEPVLGNAGVVTPVDGFHETIRECCDEHGALFVLDEVITGFRVGGLACAQGRYGIDPDVTTFGKIVGGGFPVGAIGGRAEVIDSFTPSGDVFQSGTFSGHPVTMSAGLATLRYARDEDVYAHVDRLGERLRSGLVDLVADHAPGYTVTGLDSVFKIAPTRDRAPPQAGACRDGCAQSPDCPRYGSCPKTGTDVAGGETGRWDRLLRPAMKAEGVLLPANAMESQFVCAAHTDEDVDRTLEAYGRVLADL